MIPLSLLYLNSPHLTISEKSKETRSPPHPACSRYFVELFLLQRIGPLPAEVDGTSGIKAMCALQNKIQGAAEKSGKHPLIPDLMRSFKFAACSGMVISVRFFRGGLTVFSLRFLGFMGFGCPCLLKTLTQLT